MPTVRLKNRGIVLLLCLASFVLGRFLIPPVRAPGPCVAVSNKASMTLIDRYDSTNIKSRDLKKESEIGSAGVDLDTTSERFSAFDQLKEVADYIKKIPGFDSEDEDDQLVQDAIAVRWAPITKHSKDERAIVKDDKAITKQSPPIKHMPIAKAVAKPNFLPSRWFHVTQTKLLDTALKSISPDVKASFAYVTGLKYDNNTASVIWPNFAIQKKWSLLTAGMRRLGYEQRLPTVICLGVKKSGTTAVMHYLVQHPQITRALLEEVHYFSIDYERGIDYYRARMGFSPRNVLQFEKSPSYFVEPGVAPRMLKDLPPNVKFVVCVRDPVERTISDFRHEFELKLHRDPYQALGETPATQAKHFEESMFTRHGEVDLSTGIVNESLYSFYFKNWLQQFPRDRFYILSHERVNKDLYSELKNLEKFLGLQSFYKRSMFFFNEQRQAPCMWSGCPPKSTPGFLPKAELSPHTMKKLRDFFRPYNQEFQQLTQMKFPWTNL